MIALRMIMYTALIGYLLRQAVMDAKTGCVVKIYNNVALAISFTVMIVSLWMTREQAVFLLGEIILVYVSVWFISSDVVPKWLKIMQKADAKAFASIYSSSYFIFGSAYAVKILCFSALFANLSFMVWYHLIKKEKVQMVSDVHKPYFPFILFGYVITTAVYVVLMM